MKIDIETKGSLVYVRVQLDRPKEGKFKKNKLMTKDILQILNQRGIDTTICVKAPPVVTNKKNNQFIRVMPNMPALVSKGMSCLVANKTVTTKNRNKINSLFLKVGKTLWLNKEKD